MNHSSLKQETVDKNNTWKSSACFSGKEGKAKNKNYISNIQKQIWKTKLHVAINRPYISVGGYSYIYMRVCVGVTLDKWIMHVYLGYNVILFNSYFEIQSVWISRKSNHDLQIVHSGNATGHFVWVTFMLTTQAYVFFLFFFSSFFYILLLSSRIRLYFRRNQ